MSQIYNYRIFNNSEAGASLNSFSIHCLEIQNGGNACWNHFIFKWILHLFLFIWKKKTWWMNFSCCWSKVEKLVLPQNQTVHKELVRCVHIRKVKLRLPKWFNMNEKFGLCSRSQPCPLGKSFRKFNFRMEKKKPKTNNKREWNH